MTDEQINIAIAEACGWRQSIGRHPKSDRILTIWTDGKSNFCHNRKLPSYCNDLNAMHEAEKGLTEEQEAKYVTTLCLEVQDKPRLHHATARQRAEAFLRTIGKWEESESES